MSIKPRTADVVIYQGDDLAKLGELRQVAAVAQAKVKAAKESTAEAKESGTARGGDTIDHHLIEDAKAAEDAYDEALDAAAERAETVVLHDIGAAHRDLRLKYPARRVTRVRDGEPTEIVHEEDVDYGVDTSEYPMAVLAYADPDDEDLRTIAEPNFGGEAGLKKFLRRLSDGDFDKLWITTYHLNTTVSADPKLSRYSETPQTSSATSE